MHPVLTLDTSIVAANARAWQAYAGTPLYAVVKGNGYGWGIGTLARALDDVVEAFCVADEEELRALRAHTSKRAILFGSVPERDLEGILALNALPTMTSLDAFTIAYRCASRIRIGLQPATSWSGSSFDELRAFAPHLAALGNDVEMWTHLTDWDHRSEQHQRFEEAVRVLRDAGVRVVATDVASTTPLANDGPYGATMRVGVGLFGGTGGQDIPGVRCALQVSAPVIRIETLSEDARIGYGDELVPRGTEVAVARCGYADGLSREIAGSDDIVSVGMQYVSAYARRLNDTRTALTLLDATTSLDAFAKRAQRLPHEVVTAFGNAQRTR